MNKILAVILGVGLFSLHAQAAVVESVTGETFAGYANTFVATNTTLWTDLGNASAPAQWSTDAAVNAARITDTSAGTSVLGDTSGAYIDLAFDTNIVDGAGNDLKLFFVGANGHNFDVTIGSITKSFSLAPNANTTGSFDPAYPTTDPVIELALDLGSFAGLADTSFSQIRLTIGDGFTSSSAVPSFVGTYNVSTVPVPAAVWLFGSGLVGLVSVARRSK